MSNRWRLVVLLAIPNLAGVAHADVVTIEPSHDNTLIESSMPLSAGSSPHIYAGRVGSTGNGTRRRGLLRFDLPPAIPSGSVIHSAELMMTVTQTVAGPHVVSLHRATTAWGEAGSSSPGGAGAPAEPGDATWTLRFYPGDPWNSPGGDFASTPSSAALIASYGTYHWPSTASLVADVQEWVDRPETNRGWVAIGDETAPTTVKQFASREAGDRATRPTLVIQYTPPKACVPADLDCDGLVGSADLAVLLGSWGIAPPSATADLTGDGHVDGADLATLLAAWSPALE